MGDATIAWGDPPPAEDPRQAMLRDEEEIVWLEDVSAQPYVRESVAGRLQRRGKIRCWRGRCVGYANLRRDMPLPRIKGFARRYWWLAPEDPYDGGGYPIEAVDPRSVRIGQPSARSTR